MTFDFPAWAPFELGASLALPAAAGAGGRVVAVLASEASVDAGWAGEVAVALAQGWTEAGARVVLADAGLDRPRLHTAMGTPPDEGLTDALRWGASVKRVARRVPGHDFFAILGGTPVADGAAALEGPRWPALCAGFVEAGVTLAVLVPAGDSCRDGVLAQATELVVLCGPDEDATALPLGWSKPVIGVTGMDAVTAHAEADVTPGGLDEVEDASEADETAEPVGFGDPMAFLGEAADTEEGAEEDAAVVPDPLDAPGTAEDPLLEAHAEAHPPVEADEVPASVVGDTPERTGDALPVHEPVPTFEEIVEDAGGSVEPTPKPRSRARLPLVVLVVLVLAVVVLAYLGIIEIPGITPAGGQATEAPVAQAVVAQDPPPATERAPVLAYSVALGAFRDGDAAQSLVADLTSRVPGVLFHVAPVLLDGNVIHRVLAGAAADSAGAVALAAQVAAGAGMDPSSWVARWTPLAFRLEESGDAVSARARVDELEGQGVPGYVLSVPFSDGSVRHRVYAGAYSDASEASYLSGLLEKNGLGGFPLSDRTGRLPE